MANIKVRKSKHIYSGKELKDIQQPLSKDGYSNNDFDKMYGHKTKNPYWNTERDRKNRKHTVSIEYPDTDLCPLCGKDKFIYQEICGECYIYDKGGNTKINMG